MEERLSGVGFNVGNEFKVPPLTTGNIESISIALSRVLKIAVSLEPELKEIHFGSNIFKMSVEETHSEIQRKIKTIREMYREKFNKLMEESHSLFKNDHSGLKL
ncbi:hypothetical protein [Salinivibrio sp. PR6]|uniref:hypothetical protein n=1 Tax=Salinivibrio sp. PR6 TaxID=1909485 RepID=UPI001054DFCC|nr:hypothetical protein [Salinivibrio sp. PR6]